MCLQFWCRPIFRKGTIVPGHGSRREGRIFEHASIPATVTNFFLNGDAKRTKREAACQHFPRFARHGPTQAESTFHFSQLGGALIPSIVIQVPEPEKGSFNPNRPAGKLLAGADAPSARGIAKAVKDIADVLAIDPKSLKTEREVSTYIQKATAILHTQAESLRKRRSNKLRRRALGPYSLFGESLQAQQPYAASRSSR